MRRARGRTSTEGREGLGAGPVPLADVLAFQRRLLLDPEEHLGHLPALGLRRPPEQAVRRADQGQPLDALGQLGRGRTGEDEPVGVLDEQVDKDQDGEEQDGLEVEDHGGKKASLGERMRVRR